VAASQVTTKSASRSAGNEPDGTSPGQLRVPPNLSSHRLRWQAVYAHECPPHSFAIRKARLPRDGLDSMPAIFQHQPGGLETKFLDGFCRRLAGLGRKRACELAGAQMGRLRELFNGIFARECQSGLNSVGLRLKLKKGRELRLSAGTPMIPASTVEPLELK